jgi:hypothetical protein
MRKFILLTVIFSLVSFGCSSKPYQPKQYSQGISGTVSFEKKPVADADVNFSDTTLNIFVTTKTDAQGHFTVPPKDLPTGRYTVYFVSEKQQNIPKQYQSPMESPLVLSVEAGTNEFDVKLEQEQ